MYEVINEELGIKACGLGDLTAEQMSSFFGQWEDGAKIGTLTLFFEKSGDLVLNRDNPRYKEYREIAEAYLGANEGIREEIRASCTIPGVEDTFDVLDDCIQYRISEKEIFRAHNNHIQSDSQRAVLRSMMDRYGKFEAVHTAFRYGVMHGKRTERARRKMNVQ